MVSFRKVFFKIKILFKIRIRIRIMILLWISIPDLHFIHRRHSSNCVWIRQLLWKLLCPQRKSTYVRTARQPDRQTDGNIFLLVLSSKTQNMNIHQKERIFLFPHAITILSLFTYSVCDEKVKILTTVSNSVIQKMHV